tara:strand:+ start:833 stop:1621 length:789 start_codon:yes stop_codon:yes gene_type:complete
MKTLFLLFLLFFVACGVDKKTEGVVLARVGDETLTKEHLLYLVGNQASSAEVFSREVNNWVENKLLYRAALSVGLDKDLALINKRDSFYESLLISSFVNIQTKKKLITTKQEVSEYYLKNKSSFKRIDDEAVVKHFTFQTSKEAKKVKKELKKNKTKVDMEELLNKQMVQTKTIRKGGAGSNQLGFVFSGEVGDVLGPREHNGFFHIFQILQKHNKGSYLGLEKVYDEIYHRLYKEKEILILENTLDSLYLASDVFILQGGF